MTVYIGKKDITTVERGIITHQVNCLGVMGAGVALQLVRKFPSLFPSYEKFCRSNNGKLLGNTHFVEINEDLTIANLFGQSGIGRNVRQTDYNALQSAIEQLVEYAVSFQMDIYIPFKIGCGLAGGDWKIVYPIFREAVKGKGIDLYICKPV